MSRSVILRRGVRPIQGQDGGIVLKEDFELSDYERDRLIYTKEWLLVPVQKGRTAPLESRRLSDF